MTLSNDPRIVSLVHIVRLRPVTGSAGGEFVISGDSAKSTHVLRRLGAITWQLSCHAADRDMNVSGDVAREGAKLLGRGSDTFYPSNICSSDWNTVVITRLCIGGRVDRDKGSGHG